MSTALLLVDVQRNMLGAPEPVPHAGPVGAAIEACLDRAREAGWTVVHVRNNGGDGDPDAPGTAGWELVHPVRDGEHVVDKHRCDAFEGTPLGRLIPSSATVVLVGMQSEHCIRETALGALGRGHAVQLVRGAHATYDHDEPAAEVSARVERELAGAGVEVVEPDRVGCRG
ncbi:isochorismatase family protein [Saccharothrix algeriensis]|uniref:Isochorismatase family protein n=1 Tax=Saccharothrix algeriensis TaxID=173560 RepID=A0A8T8HUX6_9PSEU|nr:isochorismatase family protein [Saccharothrix algeriensis]MBM7813069.1 nicotinamidase-related amidase [Saccharothrix algeriensis]QTR01674.1 isochorismatase family protein [Saccharothrix algeriensis]